MSHELTIRQGGTVEMAYAGATPWHGLGNKLESGLSIDAWVQAAGMDWRILRSKVRYAPNAADADNLSAWRVMDERHVLLRSDSGDALSIVSDNYKVVQPKAVLEFFRDLVGAAGFELETAGTLFGGKRFWALATIGAEAAIADPRDKVKGHLLLSTSCDGSMRTEGRYTCTRVVCNNTLSAARGDKAGFAISHRTTFDADAAKQELGIGEAQESFADAMTQFRRLAETTIDKPALVAATGSLLIPNFAEMDSKAQIESLQKSKPAMMVGSLAVNPRKMLGGDMVGMHGTVYGWLNAVTEYVDHHARTRSVDNRLASAWFGNGDALKTKAYEMAVQMADGGTRYRTVHGADAGAGLLDSVLAATRDC